MQPESLYIVGTIDAAQIALYAFWAFFFGLVVWLVRENMREGYPTISEQDGRLLAKAFILPRPKQKVYLRRDGTTRAVPDIPDEYELKAVPTNSFTGAPLTPTGDPLVDGVGPAAWTKRPEFPDRDHLMRPRIRPMRFDNQYRISEYDVDPRGFDCVCCDGKSPGQVVDVWIDRAEFLIRYFEVVTPQGSKLVPNTLARINGQDRILQVRSVTSEQFLRAPSIKASDEITLHEEDKVQAYFTGGTLYATPARTEPLI